MCNNKCFRQFRILSSAIKYLTFIYDSILFLNIFLNAYMYYGFGNLLLLSREGFQRISQRITHDFINLQHYQNENIYFTKENRQVYRVFNNFIIGRSVYSIMYVKHYLQNWFKIFGKNLHGRL